MIGIWRRLFPQLFRYQKSKYSQYRQDISNFSGYFLHAWPNPSNKIELTCRKFRCLSACKKSNYHPFLSWDIEKIFHIYLEYFRHVWSRLSIMILSTCGKIWCLSTWKLNCTLHFFFDILQRFFKFDNLGALGMTDLAH